MLLFLFTFELIDNVNLLRVQKFLICSRKSIILLNKSNPIKENVPVRQGHLPPEVPAQIQYAQRGEESVHEEGEFRISTLECS